MKNTTIVRIRSVDPGYEMLFGISKEIAADKEALDALLLKAKAEAARLNALDHESVDRGGDGGCDEAGTPVQEAFKNSLLSMGFIDLEVIGVDFFWDEYVGD